MIAESAKFRARKRGESTKIYSAKGAWEMETVSGEKNFSLKELNNWNREALILIGFSR